MSPYAGFLAFLTCSVVFGQSLPSFEVASVKAAPNSGSNAGRITVTGDTATFSNRTMVQLLTYAYGIGCCDRIKGPNWIFSDRYDIIARIPANAPKEQVPLMLRTLAAERFHLVTHVTTQEMQVYDLATQGPLRLKKVDGAAVKNNISIDNGHRLAKSMDMAGFATYITLTLRTSVIDRTGLDGYYDFPYEPSREETLRDADPSIFDLLADLGLSLRAHKAPLDVLAVDSGDRVPQEN